MRAHRVQVTGKTRKGLVNKDFYDESPLRQEVGTGTKYGFRVRVPLLSHVGA